jgi:MscS family membrane protein
MGAMVAIMTLLQTGNSAAQTPPADTAAPTAADTSARAKADTALKPDSAAMAAVAPAAQDEPPFSEDSALATPYHTVYTHYYYMQDSTFNPQKAAQALFPTPKLSAKRRKRLAVMIHRFRRGKGIYIYPQDLPRKPNYVDTVRKQQVFVLDRDYPDLYLEKVGDQWLYSRKTLKEIPKLYHTLYPWGIDRIITHIPAWAKQKVLGLELWQYFGLVLFVLLALALHKLLSKLFRVLVDKLVSRFYHANLTKKDIFPVVRPLSVYLLLLFFRQFVPALMLPHLMNKYIQLGFKIIIPVFAVVIVYRLVDLIASIFKSYAEETASTLDDQIIPLVQKTAKVIVVILGTLMVLHNLDYNITTLVAGLSIGGLAFALAAQDTLKNFFGSLMIFLDRPFQLGDWIKFADKQGIVEKVDMRSTRVRTFDDSLVYIPNGKLSDSVIDNFGLRSYRRFYTEIAIQYDTPPALIDTYVQGLRQLVQEHPATVKQYGHNAIYLNNFGDSSLNILFYVFFDVASWFDELTAREELMMGAIRLAEQLGVRFAFPTQTLHVENFPGQPSLSADYSQSPTDSQAAISAFLQRERGSWVRPPQRMQQVEGSEE